MVADFEGKHDVLKSITKLLITHQKYVLTPKSQPPCLYFRSYHPWPCFQAIVRLAIHRAFTHPHPQTAVNLLGGKYIHAPRAILLATVLVYVHKLADAQTVGRRVTAVRKTLASTAGAGK